MFFDKLFKSNDQKVSTRAKRDTKPDRARTETKRHFRQKIPVSELRIGMYVVELDKPWSETNFMFQGLEIKTEANIKEIQDECRFVLVDYDQTQLKKTEKSEPASYAGVGSTASNNPIEEELQAATQVHAMANIAVTRLFEDIRLGGELDGTKLKQAVNGCVESIIRNPDASVWLTRIQAKDSGTAQHSMNVAALSIVVAKSMDLPSKALEDIGVCGMLHDVGKTRVSSEVLACKGPLNDAQMEEMRKHTIYGRDLLLSTKSVMNGAADVAHSHHERNDGTGYPRKLRSENIPVFAKIVSIAEAYDVMTTNQPYRAAMSPSEAMQELYANRGKQFEEELVISFIDAIGIFPPGSIVEMTNGEIGIVLSNTSDKLRPRVILILDETHEPSSQRIVDLSTMELDGSGDVYQIKTTLRDGSYGIDVAEFQRAGLRMG